MICLRADAEAPDFFGRDRPSRISERDMDNSKESCVSGKVAAVFLTLLLGLTLPSLGSGAGEIVFSAAPRESAAKSLEIYEPLATYLSQAIGRPVVYRHSGNWLSYQTEMRKDTYDLLFDGPAFIGWRMEKQSHVPLVKAPGKMTFAAIALADNDKIKSLKDLAGRTLCGFAPPNMATLTVQLEFDNPVRQPILVEVQGFRRAYDMVVEGKCAGGVLQAKLLEEFERDSHRMKVLFLSKPVPNQGFSAGPRVGAATRAKIVEALLSDEGKRATQRMREDFKGQDFVPATAKEYEGLGIFLKDSWGFGSAAIGQPR
jgi:ABC-type phosphate/phosphonate transport system substrate-binding protein